jgi:hypothetical protein
MDFHDLLSMPTIIFLIPIFGILAGIVGGVMKHRERMAMIERGIHPDSFRKGEAQEQLPPPRR